MTSALAVIPARYASTRFPGKPLALLAGRPLVQHVVERCRRSGAFTEVVVATDDERIAQAVRGFGGSVELTSPEHPSGTDRIAEVVRRRAFTGNVVNVQGDEPLIPEEALRQLAALLDEPGVELATLVRPLEEAERGNPNVVKALLSLSGDALYFSRADLPFDRDGGAKVSRYAHLGLYGYRAEALLRLTALPSTPLEQAEKLEQLRALEHGLRLRCGVTRSASLGVDTPQDLARAEALLSRRG